MLKKDVALIVNDLTQNMIKLLTEYSSFQKVLE